MADHDAAEFSAVLGSPEKPLIVSGQAVNIWAGMYVLERPKLEDFAPFTSKDADIYGTKMLAEAIAQRVGWKFVPSKSHDSIMVGELTKSFEDKPALKIEVLREVNGLTDQDLERVDTVEPAPGEVYRILTPPALLKGKLYNLVSLVGLDRPQDLKHTRMLLEIVPQYLNEMSAAQRAGTVSVTKIAEAIDYLRDITHSNSARNAARIHNLDFHDLIPSALLNADSEVVQTAVTRYFHDLPPRPVVYDDEPSDILAIPPPLPPLPDPDRRSRGRTP